MFIKNSSLVYDVRITSFPFKCHPFLFIKDIIIKKEMTSFFVMLSLLLMVLLLAETHRVVLNCLTDIGLELLTTAINCTELDTDIAFNNFVCR
jgi:hypothetical protein